MPEEKSLWILLFLWFDEKKRPQFRLLFLHGPGSYTLKTRTKYLLFKLVFYISLIFQFLKATEHSPKIIQGFFWIVFWIKFKWQRSFSMSSASLHQSTKTLMILWDSRALSDHYIVKQWLTGSLTQLRQCNVTHLPLIPHEKIILPPLHVILLSFN